MDLKIKDIVELLQVSEKTVYRWIKEKKIPCYRIQHQYRFSTSEINEWILSTKIELSSNLLDLSLAKRQTNFTDLLHQGGVHENITGDTISEVLHNAIKRIRIRLPESVDTEDIAQALLNREQLMTTAIGHGIAIPHPRHPIVAAVEDARVAVCFLEKPVDFGALDGIGVHTLFILLTHSPRRHLEVLSKISYMCQLEKFREMLSRRASEPELLDFIKAKELQWQEKNRVNA